MLPSVTYQAALWLAATRPFLVWKQMVSFAGPQPLRCDASPFWAVYRAASRSVAIKIAGSLGSELLARARQLVLWAPESNVPGNVGHFGWLAADRSELQVLCT